MRAASSFVSEMNVLMLLLAEGRQAARAEAAAEAFGAAEADGDARSFEGHRVAAAQQHVHAGVAQDLRRTSSVWSVCMSWLPSTHDAPAPAPSPAPRPAARISSGRPEPVRSPGSTRKSATSCTVSKWWWNVRRRSTCQWMSPTAATMIGACRHRHRPPIPGQNFRRRPAASGRPHVQFVLHAHHALHLAAVSSASSFCSGVSTSPDSVTTRSRQVMVISCALTRGLSRIASRTLLAIAASLYIMLTVAYPRSGTWPKVETMRKARFLAFGASGQLDDAGPAYDAYKKIFIQNNGTKHVR